MLLFGYGMKILFEPNSFFSGVMFSSSSSPTDNDQQQYKRHIILRYFEGLKCSSKERLPFLPSSRRFQYTRSDRSSDSAFASVA